MNKHPTTLEPRSRLIRSPLGRTGHKFEPNTSEAGAITEYASNHMAERKEVYLEVNNRCKDLLLDIITEFRPAAIKTCSRPMRTTEEACLGSRGVELEKDRSNANIQTISDIIYWKDFRPPPGGDYFTHWNSDPT